MRLANSSFSKRLLPLAIVGLFSVSAAEAALVVPAGNSLVVNDTDLNITWTQDANLFKTMLSTNPNLVTDITSRTPTYNDPSWGVQTIADSILADGVDDFDTTNGQMTWWGEKAWVNFLNSISYGGVTGWRLPSADTACDYNYNCTNSELGHLFYTELGGTANSFIGTVHNASYELFSNVQRGMYWSGTERLNRLYAWGFATGVGLQADTTKTSLSYGWAVRDGQVSAVPLPAGVWLMGSAIVGLLGLGRRKAGTLAVG